jgi:hypothetical protein
MKYKKINSEVHLKEALHFLQENGEIGLVRVFKGKDLVICKHEDTTHVLLPWRILGDEGILFPIKENYEDIEGEEFEYKERRSNL